jgi:hypothetical protein
VSLLGLFLGSFDGINGINGSGTRRSVSLQGRAAWQIGGNGAYSVVVTFEARVNRPASKPLRAAKASESIWTGNISTTGWRDGQVMGS